MYFLIRVHVVPNYTKIKGLNSGKIYIIAKLTCVISVIAENIPHAHHQTHFHMMKVVTILFPSFHGLR